MDIGVIVVHGIGEQGRFEHLDNHVRGLINALRRRPGNPEVTVEIVSGGQSAVHATQATWRTGPCGAIRIVLRDSAGITRLHVHEVWWADVNEPYSVWKQLRFWAWGLSVWAYPAHAQAFNSTQNSMFPPRPGKGGDMRLKGRIQLFLVCCFFLLTSLTVGTLTVVLRRLLNIEAPNIVRIFANYLSSVKLFTQKSRSTGDFLDAIGEPPRISVRRRMVRTMAEVACQPYDRWYVLAHSQGAVVAFNGLMEPAFGWPGYLDEDGLAELRRHGMAGPVAADFTLPLHRRMVPAWPAWSPWGMRPEVAYRHKIFAKFGGLLTYGAPIEKFAAIWPARVPVCREPAFAPGTRWLNIFDPVDPVSGVMRSWPTEAPANLPPPENFGYPASPILLLGHIKYMDCPATPLTDVRDLTLPDAVAEWLLTGREDGFKAGCRFFAPHDATFKRRGAIAVVWCVAAFAAAAAAANVLLAPLVWAGLSGLLKWHRPPSGHGWVAALLAIMLDGVVTLSVVGIVVFIAGALSRLRTDKGLVARRPADVAFTPIDPPYPDSVP